MSDYLKSTKNSVAFIVFIILVATYSLFAGKEMSWDTLNHHLYIPYAWVTGHISSDIFGAGPQSYQNPLGYLPFYFLIKAGFKDIIIGFILAALHSINIFLLWLLAKNMWKNQENPYVWSWLAALLALLTPVFLIVSGTSSADPVGSIFVIYGFYALISHIQYDISQQKSKFLTPILGGIALGLSFAIKQSNAVFIIAAGIVLIIQWIRHWISWHTVKNFVLGLFIGLLAGMGWYSWFLWKNFANPVFPLFNTIFKSPYYSTQSNSTVSRFIPESITEFLLLPINIAKNKQWVYTEFYATDSKLALFFVLLVVIGLVYILKKIKFLKKETLLNHWTKMDTCLSILVLCIYPLWVITSTNGRYALPLFLLSGLLVIRFIYLLLPKEWAKISAGLLIVIQSVMMLLTMHPRLNPVPWNNSSYFEVLMEKELKEKPSLHLTMATQTNAMLNSYFPTTGVSVNVIGQTGLTSGDTPMLYKKFTNLLEQWQGNTRVLLEFAYKVHPKDVADPDRYVVYSQLYLSGLDINWDDCKSIEIKNDVYTGKFLGYINLINKKDKGNEQATYLLSCAVVPQLNRNPILDKELNHVKGIIKKLRSQCPNIYVAESTTVPFGKNVWKVIFESKPPFTLLINFNEDSVFMDYERSLALIKLGDAGYIEKNGTPLTCDAQHYSNVSIYLLDTPRNNQSKTSNTDNTQQTPSNTK